MTTPILYLIAAPIGNLRDMSARALACLEESPLIAAEDTRVARRLLAAFDLRGKEYFSIRAHNENVAAAALINKIQECQVAAYLSDAGTPAISDPGARLVRAVRAAGIRTIPIAGASALTTILSVGGVANDAIHFFGFAPRATNAQRQFFTALPQYAGAIVLFESPRRVAKTIAMLCESFGDEVRAVIGRELTKQHEQIIDLPLGEMHQAITNGDIPLRGEFTILIDSPGRETALVESRALFDALVKELPPAKAAKIAAKLGGGDADALYKMHIQRK